MSKHHSRLQITMKVREIKALDELRALLGMSTRAELVRAALRYYSKVERTRLTRLARVEAGPVTLGPASSEPLSLPPQSSEEG